MNKKIEIYNNVMEHVKQQFENIIKNIINIFDNNIFNKGENKHFNKDNPNYSKKLYDNKEIKHHPKRHFLDYNDVVNLRNINNWCNDVSISLLVINQEELNKNIMDTVKRRMNHFMYYYNIDNKDKLQLFLSNDIENWTSYRKYLNEYVGEEIRIEFEEFIDQSGNIMYEFVYKIKTENNHNFILTTSDNKKYLCEYILICCKGNKYNIMFYSDKIIEIKDNQFEYLYNNIK